MSRTTPKSGVLQLTRAVDPNAIAIFLNYRLQSQGITARVILKQSGLQILLEASQIPPQQASVAFVRQIIAQFRISVTESIKIYGRIRGRQAPSWSQQLSCQTNSQPEPSVRGAIARTTKVSAKIPAPVAQSAAQSQHCRISDRTRSSPKASGALKIGLFTLILLPGLLLGHLTNWKFPALIPIAHFQPIHQAASPLPVLPPPQSQAAIFSEAIHHAIQASTRTQTAKNREDWQQVSDLWQEAIGYLEKITPTYTGYATAQQKITEYQRNFVYAQQQFQALPKPTGLGISKQSIQSLFENAEVGFRFRNSTAVDGKPRIMGQSSNGLAMLELIGSSAELTKVTMVVGLPDDNASASALNRIYLLRLLQHLLPEWHDAADWLTESTVQLADGYEGDLITIRNRKRIKLSAIGGAGTLVLVIEPN